MYWDVAVTFKLAWPSGMSSFTLWICFLNTRGGYWSTDKFGDQAISVPSTTFICQLITLGRGVISLMPDIVYLCSHLKNCSLLMRTFSVVQTTVFFVSIPPSSHLTISKPFTPPPRLDRQGLASELPCRGCYWSQVPFDVYVQTELVGGGGSANFPKRICHMPKSALLWRLDVRRPQGFALHKGFETCRCDCPK